MGVASYREDIYLRFLESTEVFPDAGFPGPPDEICPFCGSHFETQTELLEHLSGAHRGDRPVLLLHGREPDRHHQVGYRLRKHAIILQNCTSVRACVNGGASIRLPSNHIAGLLADELDAIIDLELENKFDASAEPIRQLYRLIVLVPSKHHLDEVDRAFVEHLGRDAPHMAQVANFLQDSRCDGIAADYGDALATYVRGVLIKDQDSNTGVSLRPAEARELYGDALARLREFPRLLPNVVCGLIRFALNDFSASAHPTGVTRLDQVVAVLAPLLGKKGPAVQRPTSADALRTVALCPVDHGVDRVLRLGDSLAEQRRWGRVLQEECRDAAAASTLEPPDRQKILALWAARALQLQSTEQAAEPLRQLRATYPFGHWAEEKLEEFAEVLP
jgi:hypothetical protein